MRHYPIRPNVMKAAIAGKLPGRRGERASAETVAVRPAPIAGRSAIKRVAAATMIAVATTAAAALTCLPAVAASAVPATVGIHDGAIDASLHLSAYGEYLVNYNSHLCLGIAGGRANARAVQWNCNNSANQAWHWGAEYGNSGYYQLANGDNQCLGILGGSTAVGAQVVGWSCLPGHRDQYWYMPGLTCNGDYPIANLKSGQVVGVSGNSRSNGANVIQWPYQKKCNNQFWAWSIPALCLYPPRAQEFPGARIRAS
jgi:Ricin-type beta-trefoil lectin domain-like